MASDGMKKLCEVAHVIEADENGGAKLGHGSGGIVLLRAV
jgi:hypothetical protein